MIESMNYEYRDNLMIELLKDCYDSLVWSYFDAYDRMNYSGPQAHILEDLQHDVELMESVRNLISYYTVGDEGNKMLDAIYEKHYYSRLLSSMGFVNK